MIFRYLIGSIIALFLTFPAFAQIEMGGTPWSSELRALDAEDVVVFPAVDAGAMMAEDAAKAEHGSKGPLRFGIDHSMDLDMTNSGRWDQLPNGDRVWRIGLHAIGALSINLLLGEFVIPEGARLYLYNEAGERRGAFTAESRPGQTSLAIAPIAGERITVEYDRPAHAVGPEAVRITQVGQAYRDILGFGSSGACNVNTICPEGEGFRDQIAAVALITVGGSYLCTGTLINNCANDGTPYFLTARHCTQGSNTANWTFRFDWESPECTPTTNAPTNLTVSGAELLATNVGSDMSLLLLNTPPPANYGIYYTGWDKSGDIPDTVHCIHHPSGDIKKISASYGPLDQATVNFGNETDCWHIPQWDSGTTEPGSSGSGLLDQHGRLIGQLYGGYAACSYNVDDYYGRFDLSYPLIEPWLGSCGDAIDGFDPNDDSGVAETDRHGNNLLVRPNPGSGSFVLSLNGRHAEMLVLHDALGRALMHWNVAHGIDEVNFDLGNRPDGIYFLDVQGGGMHTMVRVVLHR